MRHFIWIFFFLLILESCNAPKTEQENKIVYNSNLTKSKLDTLSIKGDYYSKRHRTFFYDEEAVCLLANDTIKIFNHGYMTDKSISIFISKDSFQCTVRGNNCTYSRVYKTILQKIELNKSNFSINDTIIGDLFLKAIWVFDSVKKTIDTVTIKGKFKFRIRDSNYSYDVKYQEKNYARFMEWTKLKPDTFKSLDMWDCGLTSLPKELLLFENVEELDLRVNNFQNADLSSLCKLKKLKKIVLSFCHLNAFPEDVLCISNLEDLDITENDIRVLPDKLFDKSSLKRLQLERDGLTTLSEKISKLRNLEELCLYNNKIKKLPKSIILLSKLKSFGEPDSLEYLPKQLKKLLY
ncbi:MAG: hypothetical protein ABI388_12600 [Bacteroidia bacterium]